MKKAKKVLLLALCAVLLVGATIAGTVAYLTSQATVKNTFTVGKVAITMDEAAVNEYGQKLNDKGAVAGNGDTLAARKTENTYKLVPGLQYTKDPTIHVDTESEPCYLFVKIENGISATLSGQTGWTNISGTNFWKYDSIVAPGGDVVVFNSFTYSADVTDTTSDAANKIQVTAYAIQADGFADVDAAWEASGFGTK